MATQIHALDRGGWSAYGNATVDERDRTVYIQAEDNEEHALTVTFQSSVSSVTTSANGAATTTPSISSATFTCELTELDSGGYVDFTATLSSGEVKRLRVRGRPPSADANLDYGR